jgi:flavin-dependent dehydrogenase
MYQEPPERCDVAIVGAGPAGSALAVALRHLRPDLDVLLIDGGRSRLPVQSASLERDAQALLQSIGFWDTFIGGDPAVSRGTTAAWGSTELRPHEFFFAPPRQGWRLDRQRFATLMRLGAAAEGVAMTRVSALQGAKLQDGGVYLELDVQGRFCEVQARFAVDASGRRAGLALRLGAQKIRYDRLIGAFVVLTGRTEAFEKTDVYVESHPQGWWYGSQEAAERVVVGFQTDADLARAAGVGSLVGWRQLFADSAVFTHLGDLEPDGDPAVYTIHCQRLDRMGGDSWLAVGDAAAAADPLATPGLRRALASGIDAAHAVAAALSGRNTGIHRYLRSAGQQFDTYLDARRKIYEGEQRWPEQPFWKRRREQADLDRDVLLSYAPEPENERRLAGLDMHLAPADLALLCELCVAPRLVQAVLKAFHENVEDPPSDRRVLMALRYLVDQGVIDAT